MEKTLLYVKVRNEIVGKIQKGDYSKDERLPSELEIARELGVGRSTVREAVKILQKDGILISKNGNGTFINKNTSINNYLNRLQSMGEMIKQAGFKESESDVSIYKMKAEPEWAEKLKCEDVTVIERKRTADGETVAYYYNIFPQELAGSHFDDGFSGAIFKVIEEKMGLAIFYSNTEICAFDENSQKDQRAAKILGSGILLLKQLHFDDRDNPVFYSLDYIKNSALKLFVKRYRL